MSWYYIVLLIFLYGIIGLISDVICINFFKFDKDDVGRGLVVLFWPIFILILVIFGIYYYPYKIIYKFLK